MTKEEIISKYTNQIDKCKLSRNNYNTAAWRSYVDRQVELFESFITDINQLDSLPKEEGKKLDEIFKRKCTNCGIDELFTDNHCNCCGAKQISFFGNDRTRKL